MHYAITTNLKDFFPHLLRAQYAHCSRTLTTCRLSRTQNLEETEGLFLLDLDLPRLTMEPALSSLSSSTKNSSYFFLSSHSPDSLASRQQVSKLDLLLGLPSRPPFHSTRSCLQDSVHTTGTFAPFACATKSSVHKLWP
jgi:hypothetical protein